MTDQHLGPRPTIVGPDSAALPVAADLIDRFPVTPNPDPRPEQERAKVMERLSFGVDVTDHMAIARWSLGEGWGHHAVVPYGPLAMDPAASVLHYGQEIFEGLKAYRHADGSIWCFRPGFNAARLNHSARRLALPELPEEDFVASIAALVRAEADWVPDVPGASLYLRPFMFSAEPFLGVRAGRVVDYLVIASPSGPYFPNGFLPIAVWVTTEYARAGRGGTGSAKTGGNYASSLIPKLVAKDEGFEEVCFLDAGTSTNVDELGGMNLFVVHADGTVRTPALTGAILEGGTRGAILQLLADQGRPAREETIALDGLLDNIRTGEVTEVFACGTAAVITPVGRLAGEGFDLTVGDGNPGPTTLGLYETLTDIQYGRRPDPHHWTYRLV